MKCYFSVAGKRECQFFFLVIDLPDSIEQDFRVDLDDCDEEQSNDLTDLVLVEKIVLVMCNLPNDCT